MCNIFDFISFFAGVSILLIEVAYELLKDNAITTVLSFNKKEDYDYE